ncbi:MAG: aldo/keto reductase [Firmicutes bacterium]|jgi:aryl-alcohol dehydrogenase-like predicted oxidoreductase|nr:aldo/keto reductase [Bacillota bacterium]
MEYRTLGRTGLRVSRLVLGTLSMGPLQADLGVDEGAALIRAAVELGVNLLDTAEVYGNYPHIRKGLRGLGDEMMVAGKSYACTWDGMKRSVEAARRGIDRDVIDIFLLHEQVSALTLEGHRPALEYLLEAKVRGIVRAVGVSTHFVEVVNAAAGMPDVEVIHPLLNRSGIGVRGGTLDQMVEAVTLAHASGKGVYAMKALGGGTLLEDVESSLAWVRDLPCVDAVAVGAADPRELEMDALVMAGGPVPESLRDAVRRRPKVLVIEESCTGCGECVKACQFGALAVVEGRARVSPSSCTLCGYCAARCEGFFIRVV